MITQTKMELFILNFSNNNDFLKQLMIKPIWVTVQTYKSALLPIPFFDFSLHFLKE